MSQSLSATSYSARIFPERSLCEVSNALSTTAMIVDWFQVAQAAHALSASIVERYDIND